MEYGDPTKAEVTWNGSKSYRFAGNSKLIFKNGKTKTLEDTDLIKRCQSTYGFAVQVVETYTRPKKEKKSSKKKIVRSVERSGSKKRKKTKKKTSRSYSD